MKKNTFANNYMLGIVIMMIISFIILLVPDRKQQVINLQFQDNIIYSGTLTHHKFSGEGTLIDQSLGKFQGEFTEGRLEGLGTMQGNDWLYEAYFVPGEPNRDVSIILKNNEKWTLKEGVWTKLEDKETTPQQSIEIETHTLSTN